MRGCFGPGLLLRPIRTQGPGSSANSAKYLDLVSQRPVKPTPDQVRASLAGRLPETAGNEIAFLGEGWVCWAFQAGDYVARFPKSETSIPSLEKECRLARILAGSLPAPISQPEPFQDGPNGLPFTLHRLVPGVPLKEVARPLAPDFAASLGRFVHAVHAFRLDLLQGTGVRTTGGEGKRQECLDFYARIEMHALPMISPAARAFTEKTFDLYLAEPAHFDFVPVLTHRDIDERNILADPETGALTGVIDFGDARVDDPAEDFVCPADGYAELGIPFDFGAFVAAYDPALAFAPLTERARFYRFRWPFTEILEGVEIGNEGLMERGVRRLEEVWVTLGRSRH